VDNKSDFPPKKVGNRIFHPQNDRSYTCYWWATQHLFYGRMVYLSW
jgi:hypothetical protein